MPQPLSSKESNLFRSVIRYYEDKHYKRGLKAADQILKKNARHGDTMAMKALIMNAQGKTEEAFALSKEALTVDMKSHICWHVYGILYRTNKNFDEAIKAYKFALKLEPESLQIQRDLAILQIQIRDYQGYVQTRMIMLKSKPQMRQSWTGLAVAYHLAGNLQEAENVLSTYEDTLKQPPPKTDFEHSEAILYKNTIIAETGDFQRALEHLDSAATHNLDRLAVLELRARYLAELGRKSETIKAYRALLDRNSEHGEYYHALIKAMGIEDEPAAKKAVFDEYAEQLPRCDAARRLPLNFLTGDDFREAAKKYLTLMLNKGVPSTFANLKHLYSDSFKKATLLSLAEEYLQSAESGSAGKDEVNGDSSKGKGASLYYLAQHYNYHLSRDLTKAAAYVDKALELWPDNVDFHMTKARIWKHHGNLTKAAETMDHARTRDARDRYINSKAAKYQLRNNENDKALRTMGMFTRVDTPGGPFADLLEMQCIWFMTEDGEAYSRQGNIGMALKRFHTIFNIFEIWQEDQFDFHTFSLRKGQIRSYIDMVRWEDRLREHPLYTRAALDAVKIYLNLFDKPEGGANGVNGVDGAKDEDAAEKRKVAKKAKKEAQRAEREAAEKAAKQDPNKAGAPKAKEQGAAAEAAKKDDDPLGLKLAATSDPLGEAMKFLAPMLQFSPKNIAAQTLGFDVFIRRKKYVLALRCLNSALAIDPETPALHVQLVQYRQELDQALASLPPKVQEVLKADSTAVPPSADLRKYNADFRRRHAASVEHGIAAIRAAHLLGEDRAKCAREMTALLDLDRVGLGEAVSILEALSARPWAGGEEAAAFRNKAAEKFPEATVFAARD